MRCTLSTTTIGVVALLGVCTAFTPDGPRPITNFTAIRRYDNSTLYEVVAQQSTYGIPVLLIDLYGDSRFDMGYAYGALLGAQIREVYDTFVKAIIGGNIIDKAAEAVLGVAVDWQWKDFLSKECPKDYLDEIAGIDAGASNETGTHGTGALISRIITLANAPGDVKDFAKVLIDEWRKRHPHEPEVVDQLTAAIQAPERASSSGGHCSMFGVWGSRTVGGRLFTGRNLDWNQNTGINKYKLVTVLHPPNGNAHATVGFAGLWGALTGMSQSGLTVHEANLEEDSVTFYGFPWVLRLRYIMEHASNASEAIALWQSTNNTAGFNHGIGSSSDAGAAVRGSKAAKPFTVIETMAGYNAFFGPMDPREATARYIANGSSLKIGFPLPDALYRTNHGYDPTIRQHYEWSQAPSSWSMERYEIIHQAILDLQANNTSIDLMNAVNITAVVGDKGHDTPYVCQNKPSGTNVLSVAYDPEASVMAAAWERLNGTEWRPACCSTYLNFDLKKWW